ncbi:MAG: hypothetical protein WCG61_04640, partial [Chlorobium sp.]
CRNISKGITEDAEEEHCYGCDTPGKGALHGGLADVLLLVDQFVDRLRKYIKFWSCLNLWQGRSLCDK